VPLATQLAVPRPRRHDLLGLLRVRPPSGAERLAAVGPAVLPLAQIMVDIHRRMLAEVER
jgi:hypothetical protein